MEVSERLLLRGLVSVRETGAEERGVGAPPLTMTGAGAVGGRRTVTGVGRVMESGRGPRYVALRVTRGASALGTVAFPVAAGVTDVVAGSTPGLVVLRVT